MTPSAEQRAVVRAALAALGIDNLLLGIQDPAFPGLSGEDVGRGTPYSRGAERFWRFASRLGFTGVQLGPQGLTADDNASPYDGLLFSRNPLSVALMPLVEDGLLSPKTLESLATQPGPRAQHRTAALATRCALDEAYAAFVAARGATPSNRAGLASRLTAFREREAEWLVPDALYEALGAEHGEPHWRRWRRGQEPHPDQRLCSPHPGEEATMARRREELLAKHAARIERYAFAQLVAHEQHAALTRLAAELGLELFGDLQIGVSEADAWRHRDLFLEDYVMGAPPSRTNPDGQPWNYPVLDPDRYHDDRGGEGPALRFVRRRLDKLFAEFDGMRLDHPHGLVCPWVYRASQPDSLRAVQGGARLFESPAEPDHPGLARYAIVGDAQLDGSRPRHADDRVRDLSDEQVARFATLIDAMVAAARQSGRSARHLLCEVLSTQPLPLRKVAERHGLGRLRVTQKADVTRPEDGYRGENAAPADWIMVGNHDTPPLQAVARGWSEAARLAQARYLATRLVPEPAQREAWASRTAADPQALVAAKLAELFVGPARNVMVFFTDLFGMEEPFNVPGSSSDDNWSLRVPADFEQAYPAALAARRGLDLPRALAVACRARGAELVGAQAGSLVQQLERIASAQG